MKGGWKLAFTILIAVLFNVVLSVNGAWDFQGGIVSMQPVGSGFNNYLGQYEIEVSVQLALRRDSSYIDTFCTENRIKSGYQIGKGVVYAHFCSALMCRSYHIMYPYISVYCTDFSIDENWSLGERSFSQTFSSSLVSSATSKIALYAQGCCWVPPYFNNWNLAVIFYVVSLRNDTGRINSTPRAQLYPVIRLQANCNHSFTIPTVDPDGDRVRCRWAAASDECGGACGKFPGAVLEQATCTIYYSAPNATGYSVLALMLEDFGPNSTAPYSSVALQSLVEVFASNGSCVSKPSFLYPTYRDGECLAYPANISITGSLVASTVKPYATLKFEIVPPRGMQLSSVYSKTGRNAVDLAWRPTVDQIMQAHLLCFQAVASSGVNSTQRCAKFMIGSAPPMLLQVSPNNTQIGPMEPKWRLKFSERVTRPKWQAYIRFVEKVTWETVYSLDTSTSSEIALPIFGSDAFDLKVKFNFSNNLAYYVLMERGSFVGRTGCNLSTPAVENAAIWTFITNATQGSICNATSTCSCNQSSCGQKFNPPRGACVFSACVCNTNWTGADCEIQVFVPVIDSLPANDTIEEGKDYTRNLTLRQGDKPLTWSLVEGPTGLSVNIFSGLVFWPNAQAGEYRIAIEVRNNAGFYRTSWTLTVRTTYRAFLNIVTPALYLTPAPVRLTGYVEFDSGSFIKQLRKSVVPVKVTIKRADVTVTLTVNTTANGTFSVQYSPSYSEYGNYSAAAHHPGQNSPANGQTKWDVLGMRAVPGSLALEGEAEVGFEFWKNFSSVTVIVNDGPGPIHDLQAQVIHYEQLVANGIEVGLFLSRGKLSYLDINENITLDITIKSARPLSMRFYVKLSSRNATELTVPCHLTVRPSLAQLVSNPATLRTRQLRGSYKTFEFNITNDGNRPASSIQVRLPPNGFLSLVGIGVATDANRSFALEPLSSAILTLASNVPRNQALGTATHDVLVTCAGNQASISVVIDVSSDLLMDFYVKVVDEYTYFVDTKPLVTNAIVKLSAGAVMFREVSDTSLMNGIAVFKNVTEGLYDLEVSAASHNRYKQVIMVSNAERQLTVFLPRSSVRYSWEVKQITLEDKYEIKLTAEFETRVPMPVVTIEPSSIDLTPYESGTMDTIVFNVTNHGLIRADSSQLGLPTDHPFLIFEIGNSDLGSIEALHSILIPVKVSRRSRERRASSACITLAVGILWSYKCGEYSQRKASYAALVSAQLCASSDSEPKKLSSFINFINFPTAAGASGVSSFSFGSASVRLTCSPCLDNILSCATDFILGFIPPVIDCPIKFIGAIFTMVSPSADKSGVLEKTEPFADVTLCITKKFKFLKKGAEFIEKVVTGFKAGECVYEIMRACLPDKKLPGRRRRSTTRAIAHDLMESLYPIIRSVDLIQEMLGDRDLILSTNSSWLEALNPAMSMGSESGTYISQGELRTILSTYTSSEAEATSLRHALERLNNTLGNWSAGVLEPTAGGNMASHKLASEIWQDITLYNSTAVAKGFDSFVQAYNYYSTEANKLTSWNDDDSAGVCAVVKIQLNQDIALTREAFQATLQISNEDVADISNLHVQLRITDAQNGNLSNEKFSIGDPKPTGELKLMGNSRMSLASSASGSAEWLLVPYSEAAPTADRQFDVGGRLIYSIGNTTVNISLTPARITVKPDPRLKVHYFWEKTVQADDPFTPEREPSMPFCVAVAVKNEGFGSALNMRITSSQPEIIDNEKGLLISFRIIASSFGSNPRQPSLVVSMGDFAPSETKVVDWWMISSLQGSFVSYTATFVNRNLLGDEKLSLLDELKIHELIKRVRIYSAGDDDKILDFLVNDLVDANDTPDLVYSSKDLSTRPVYQGELQFLSKTVTNSTAVILQVKAKPAADGWNYYQLMDSLGTYQLPHGTVYSAVRQASANETIPVENAWTQRHAKGTPRLVFSSLHLFDVGRSGFSAVYHIFICVSKCSLTGSSDQPLFDPTTVLSPPGNDTYVWTLETSTAPPSTVTSKKPEIIKSGVNEGEALQSIVALVALLSFLQLVLLNY